MFKDFCEAILGRVLLEEILSKAGKGTAIEGRAG
jgi:hypothetical protein